MEFNVSGDPTKTQEKMKKDRKALRSEITKLERLKRNSNGMLPVKSDNRLFFLERILHIYSVSKTLPVNYDGLIINGKLLQPFMKKLKGFDCWIEKTDLAIKLCYERKKPFTNGVLELYPLNHYFEEYKDIPKLEVHYNFLN